MKGMKETPGVNANHPLKRLVIEAGRGDTQYWQDIWRFRELFYFLAWRDILVRYKQTVIGIAWAIMRPLMTMIVFTIIFGKLAKFPSEGETPYAVMVFAALLPWQLFASTLTETSNSLLNNKGMIAKIYFPRLIIPASAVIVGLVDFLISFVILALMMAWYQFLPDWRLLSLPLFLLLAAVTSLGAGFWFAAINVKYRDVRFVVPFLVQFGLYVSPVGFSSSIIPDQWRLLYSINPMVGVIDGFRWAVLGGDSQIYWPGFVLSLFLAAIIFWSGLKYFRKVERTFADVI